MLLQLLLIFGIHSVWSGTLSVDRVFNSSFLLGGNRIDRAVAVITSDDGSVYLGGHTQGDGFPTLDAVQIPTDFSRKAFITVYGPGGDMRFSTTFGGDRIDELRGIAVTHDGSKVYLVGITTSTAMNTTTGIPNGGGTQDCFIGIIDIIAKRVIFSTFFGGNSTDDCQKIVINEPSGRFFVAGNTQSVNFPGISGLGDYEEAFVSIFDLNGTLLRTIIFSGHGFDTISDIAVDSVLTSWTLYVAGYTNSDNFPTTVNNTLRQGYDGWFGVLNDSGIIYVSLLGGSGTDRIYGISVDKDNIYLTGESSSIYSFPTVGNTLQTNISGQSDAFVTIVRISDFQILYSSFIGGSQQDRANSIVSDSSKNIYIAGFTTSNDYPSAGNAYSMSYFGGTYDGFLSIINWQEGNLIYSSFIGGNTSDQLNRVHIRDGSVFLAGYSDSLNYPSSVPLKGSEDATLTIVSTVDIIPSSGLAIVTTDTTIAIPTSATTGSSPSPCGLCLESQELVVQFESDSPTFKMNQISETKTDNQYVEVVWNELVEKDVSSSVVQKLIIPKTGWQITPLTRTANGAFSVQNVNFTIKLENNATLKISNYLYEVETTISYGSYQLSVSPKKNKITVELWNWPFSNPNNTLSSNIHFNADSPITSRDVQDVDSFMKLYTVSTTTLKMGVDIINFALTDGQQKGVGSQWDGTQLTISFPSFEYLYYDPDFAVLVQGSKELQDPSSSSSGPNTLPWVLGALAFCFILMLVLLVGIFLYLKHIRKHKLRSTLNNQVSDRFSQVHLTPLSKRYDSDGSSVSISSSVSSDEGRISQSSEALV